MPKKLLVLLVAGVLVLPALARADAKTKEGFIGLGVQFMWNNYKQPVLAYSNDNSYIPEKDLNGFGTPNLGGNFQWGITNQFVLSLGLDLSYFRHFIYPFHDATGTKDGTHADKVASDIFTIGAVLGAKIYFWDPTPMEAVVYLSMGIGKYFGIAGSTDKLNRYDLNNDGKIEDTTTASGPISEEAPYARAKSLLDNEVEMVSKLSSPLVLQLAIGAEFWASKAFSIGADILGFRFTYAAANVGVAKNHNSTEAEWSGEQKILGFYVYSALTLNFNLSARQKVEKAETTADNTWNTNQENQWDGNSGWNANPNDNAQQQEPPPTPPPPPEDKGQNANPNPPPPPPPPPSY